MSTVSHTESVALRAALGELVALSAIPAGRVRSEPSAVADGLADVLAGSLQLEFAFVRLCDPKGGQPVEVTRGHVWGKFPGWLQAHPGAGRFSRTEIISGCAGAEDGCGVVIPIGVDAQAGFIAGASSRPGFPNEIDRLLLSVAANQAAAAFQNARLRHELDSKIAELGVARDELEMKVADRTSTLQRSEAFLSEGQKLSRTGTFVCKPSSAIMHWTEEMFRIFEYDPATTPSAERLLRRIHPDDVPGVLQVVARAQQDVQDYSHEYRLLMPDESIKHVYVVAHAYRDVKGNVEFIGAVMDVTTIRRAEFELNKTRTDLAHVMRVRSLGELTASIAHEINQPLGAVVINAEACLSWLDHAEPNLAEAHAAVERIVRDGTRAGEVLRRIRAHAEKTETTMAPLNLNDVFGEALTFVQNELLNAQVTLRTEIAIALPEILADRVQLQQVIVNLVINGIEAMMPITDRPRELVVRSAQHDAQQVEVSVADCGVGLSADKLGQLFDAFFTTKPAGMGMGLSICRSIIELHGGRIWAVPNQPHGAVIQFTLPCYAGPSGLV
jgi:C4-dicarboxylate-specific signal transduction histidine kinase